MKGLKSESGKKSKSNVSLDAIKQHNDTVLFELLPREETKKKTKGYKLVYYSKLFQFILLWLKGDKSGEGLLPEEILDKLLNDARIRITFYGSYFFFKFITDCLNVQNNIKPLILILEKEYCLEVGRFWINSSQPIDFRNLFRSKVPILRKIITRSNSWITSLKEDIKTLELDPNDTRSLKLPLLDKEFYPLISSINHHESPINYIINSIAKYKGKLVITYKDIITLVFMSGIDNGAAIRFKEVSLFYSKLEVIDVIYMLPGLLSYADDLWISVIGIIAGVKKYLPTVRKLHIEFCFSYNTKQEIDLCIPNLYFPPFLDLVTLRLSETIKHNYLDSVIMSRTGTNIIFLKYSKSSCFKKLPKVVIKGVINFLHFSHVFRNYNLNKMKPLIDIVKVNK